MHILKNLAHLYSQLQNLKDPFLQNLLLSGIHESLHKEIFKIVGNPKLDHSVLPKHDHKNGSSVAVRKNEDVSNLAADSETIPNHDPRTVGQRKRNSNKMLGGFNAPTNGSQNVERRRMRSRNRVIGGFNVTDIGNDANAQAKRHANEKHAFPWMVRVFGKCGGM